MRSCSPLYKRIKLTLLKKKNKERKIQICGVNTYKYNFIIYKFYLYIVDRPKFNVLIKILTL